MYTLNVHATQCCTLYVAAGTLNKRRHNKCTHRAATNTLLFKFHPLVPRFCTSCQGLRHDVTISCRPTHRVHKSVQCHSARGAQIAYTCALSHLASFGNFRRLPHCIKYNVMYACSITQRYALKSSPDYHPLPLSSVTRPSLFCLT